MHHLIYFLILCKFRMKHAMQNQQLTILLPNNDVSTNKDPATV